LYRRLFSFVHSLHENWFSSTFLVVLNSAMSQSDFQDWKEAEKFAKGRLVKDARELRAFGRRSIPILQIYYRYTFT